MAKVTCIDVSCWQTGVDYTKVKAAGVEAVIIRAGYGRETSQKDSQFETHYKNAKAAGLKIGAYWYSYADSVSDARTEAKACLSCIKGKTFDMPIYYDMEESGQTKYGKTTLTKMAEAFCEEIKAGGYRAGVYANLNWFTNYLDYSKLKSAYSIWLAQYNSTNQLACDIWQNSSSGKISGVSGNADTNIVFNTDIYKTTNTERKEEDDLKYNEYSLGTLAYKQMLIELKELGVIKTSVADDDGFGTGTLNATKEVQKLAKCTVDGIPGPITIRYCRKAIKDALATRDKKITNAKKALG